MTNLLKILFVLFLVNCKVHSQEYWLKQFSPASQNLAECFFTDTLNGLICGDSGLILKTTNEGQNWIFQNTGTYNNIVSLFFVNVNTGYALSH
ncbi:MAG: hypothetical protein IPL53_01580 [Ignavibacteria bacterium]|nr:hypothetical protein [Ignavibacteria bacterium]